MPRSQRNDNFIDKTFTVIADILLKILPTSNREKQAFSYYRDGMSAQSEGEYAEALQNYYEALTSSEAFVKKIYFDGKELLDESSDESEFIELRILKGSSFPKRIAMLRRTGITIYEKKRFKTPFKFIGVFQAKGVKINNFLRLLENPQHDKWMFNMYESDPKFAEKILYNLTTRWIADSIKEASGDDSKDEYDVEGMQQFFPDDSDDDVVILDDEN